MDRLGLSGAYSRRTAEELPIDLAASDFGAPSAKHFEAVLVDACEGLCLCLAETMLLQQEREGGAVHARTVCMSVPNEAIEAPPVKRVQRTTVGAVEKPNEHLLRARRQPAHGLRFDELLPHLVFSLR